MSNKLRSVKRANQPEPIGIIVKLEDLLNSRGSLQVLLAQPVAARLAFTLAKLAKAISAEIEQYEAVRKAMCERYAERDKDGKAKLVTNEGAERFDISPSKMPEFEAEHQELNQTEVTIPGQKVNLAALEGISIAPAHLLALSWLITE